LIILAALQTNSQAQQAEICHIASSGFYVSDRQKGVLIDALFADGMDGDPVASDALNKQMEGASGKFSNVRLIHASHMHEDHMKAKAILRHLRANEAAIALMPKQARTLMVAAGMAPNEKSVISPNLAQGEKQVIDGLSFPVTLYAITHGEGTGVDNMAIAINVGGKTIMHVGDMYASREEIIEAGLDKIEIDYLMLPFWYLYRSERASMIKETLNAKHIIPMHFALESSEWMQSMGGLEQVRNASYNALDNIIKLDQEMKCIALN
ncbi:MAG: MBL fold metallo-hydrolase, partial [Kordiimonadaceae bacterium]|nr:MBL fold metallo-hydrolase [Kordiimonadaceae bacterium]